MLRSRPLLVVVMLMIYYHPTYVALAEDKHHHQQKTTYIVHMDKSNMPSSFLDHFQWYESSLKSVSNSAHMIYTYNTVIHGFSARLTAEEAESLKVQQGILLVLPEVIHQLHTTRTPEFLGLERSNSLLPDSGSVSEVIVGVLDTGVWPELKSFDDTGLGPVPNSWKGECQVGNNFDLSNCNRKLIGARFFPKGYEAAAGPINEAVESKSPRDDGGHGTHTSTTAAGSAVTGASLFGYANGSARGMAASARVAAYKVCWLRGCFSTDILAGLESAIEDGVDVLSISLGGSKSDYYEDNIAIGAFAAMAQGIFVSCSAGNVGPIPGSLSNFAPWITTVGAGTLDRDFPAYVTIGNGEKFSGVSLYGGQPLPDSLLPLVYAGNATNSTKYGNLCMPYTLIPEKVAGKIVVCDRGRPITGEMQGAVVKDAGGIGMVLANTDEFGEDVKAGAHFLPTAAVGQKNGNSIKNYLFSDPNPTGTIATGNTQLGIQASPVVANFSSRGPNTISPAILKPDLIAPGVNILAGWSGAVGPSELKIDTRRVSFNIISGTSMSCPHVSGLAVLLKAAHPEWSPAAIRSALMTTAYTAYKNGGTIQDFATGRPATPFDYGAGHVDPVAALDPGLVYNATIDDYIDFLCASNYNTGEIKAITRRDFTCELGKKYNVGDLNYPSFAVPLQTAASGKGGGGGVLSTVTYTRTLTNVGTPGQYKVSVSSQTALVNILVEPESLSFNELFEKKNYTVTFTASSMPSGMTSFAHLEWSDGKHIVSSPVAFSWT